MLAGNFPRPGEYGQSHCEMERQRVVGARHGDEREDIRLCAGGERRRSLCRRSFITAGGVDAENIAKWNGSVWSALGSGVDGAVYALAVSGGDLYAGERFTARGSKANYIAKWNGSTWSALGSGVTTVSMRWR